MIPNEQSPSDRRLLRWNFREAYRECGCPSPTIMAAVRRSMEYEYEADELADLLREAREMKKAEA